MDTAPFAVVGFYLALNALLLMALSFSVIGERRGARISIGDGDNKKLAHRIRAQGNAAEYMPIFFLVMAMAAMLNISVWTLHIAGVVFTLGRFMHAYWFLKPSKNMKPRVFGMIMTTIAIIALSLRTLVQAIVIMVSGS
ncbi:MAG: MAPEG family protein [Pseudomonadota bacterium]